MGIESDLYHLAGALKSLNNTVRFQQDHLAELDNEIAQLKAEIEEIRRNGAGAGISG